MYPAASAPGATRAGRGETARKLVAGRVIDEAIDSPSDLALDAALLRLIRRRPSPQQGRALEALSHAIEYLVDSRMAQVDEPATRGDGEAINLLMRLNRNVFTECAEVVPMGRRLKAWIAGHFFRRAH